MTPRPLRFLRSRDLGPSLWPLLPAIALTWWIHGPMLSAWWTRDDPCLLRAIERWGILAHLGRSDVWQKLSSNVFMPWQLFSLGADHALFGRNPEFYYGHQLLSLTLVLGLAYLLFQRWLTPLAAGLAVWLFATSAPLYGVGQQLMNRHYLEGLGLALLSLLLFPPSIGSDATRSRLRTALSALCYLLACAAKEVYVLLPLLLLILPTAPNTTDASATETDATEANATETPRSTERATPVRALIPHLLALLFYLAWRAWMLGEGFLSGYGARPEAGPLTGLRHLVGALFPGSGWIQATALGGGLMAIGWIVWRRPRRTIGLVAFAIAVGLPLAGVFPYLEPRHLLSAALGISLVIALALDDHRVAPALRLTLGAAFALGSLALLLTSPVRRQQAASVAHHRAEGEWILRGHGDPLLTTLADGAFLECLADLRPEAPSLPPGPGYCGDPCWCGDLASRWMTFDGGTQLEASTDRARCLPAPGDEALQVDFERNAESDSVRWKLGPWEAGTYSVLLDLSDPRNGTPGFSVPIPIPREGQIQWTGDHQFVFRYQSPEGWLAYRAVPRDDLR